MSAAFKSRTKWSEKLKRPEKPEIKPAPEKWAQKHGGNRMLIPTPLLIQNLVKQIPSGKLTTVRLIREKLAAEHQADFTCPLTTGIFLRIVAEAAEESRAEGQSEIPPYWRVVGDDGTLNPKFPGGIDQQKQYLQNEGFEIIPKGKKKWMVKDFERFLTEGASR